MQTPDANAITLRICRHEAVTEWATLLAALPPEQRQVLATAGGRQERRAIVIERGGTMLGLAFGYRRPLTSYLKLALLWVPGDKTLAPRLLEAFERLAAEEGASVVKLEQRDSFPMGQQMLLAAGYQPMAAPMGIDLTDQPVGWAKPLLLNSWPAIAPPHYRQTTGMSCGPCALGMAMTHLRIAPALRRAEELKLWREATTIYAPAGPGGCDPFGLAVAALKRGLRATVYLSSQEHVLLNRASSDDKREVMRFVQDGFREEAEYLGVVVHWRAFEMDEIAEALDEGALALLLIDEDLMHAEGGPHWVLAHGRYGEAWLVNDPWTDTHLGESWIDGSLLPIPVQHLDRMCWYGDPAYRSAVVLRVADAE